MFRKKCRGVLLSLLKNKEKQMQKILFVCLGNICRSPMAEFIMKKMVKDAGLEAQTIAPGRYAVFSTKQGAAAWEALPELFELIFGSWLPDSGYELRNDDIIEVYHLWTDAERRRRERYYEVWIPVK